MQVAGTEPEPQRGAAQQTRTGVDGPTGGSVQTTPILAFSVDFDRSETNPCQRGTVGCCINHDRDAGGCMGW